MLRQAIFLDRDGVINVDKGYVYRIEDLDWVPGAIEAIRYYNEQNRLVIVITNQSGIARGLYTEEAMLSLHEYINEQLQQQDAHIDAFYYCPHHVEGIHAKYSIACDCRKPQPGMILRAIREWQIDNKTAFMVGDKESDMKAAQAAGIQGYRFLDGNLYDFLCEQGEIK